MNREIVGYVIVYRSTNKLITGIEGDLLRTKPGKPALIFSTKELAEQVIEKEIDCLCSGGRPEHFRIQKVISYVE